MKKISTWLIIMLMGLILSVPVVYADNIQAGDWVKLYDVPGHGNSDGGEFALWKSPLILGTYSYQFNTFCLETDEYFSYGEALYVSAVSKTAYGGGSNTNSGDPLDKRTAYLYYHFRMGDLDQLTSSNSDPTKRYHYATDAGANSLQGAIWYIEEETSGIYNYLVSLADAASSADLDLAYAHVSVLNLTDGGSTLKQDQLTLVPEPASILLLGLGLLGIGIIRRKK